MTVVREQAPSEPTGRTTVVAFSVDGGVLQVSIKGLGKVWALKSKIRVPVDSVREVRHDPDAARGLWKGLRLPGTHVPGLITAGTYYKGGDKVFWAVRRPERTVVVELENAPYDRLIVEAEDPHAAVSLIENARPAADF